MKVYAFLLLLLSTCVPSPSEGFPVVAAANLLRTGITGITGGLLLQNQAIATKEEHDAKVDAVDDLILDLKDIASVYWAGDRLDDGKEIYEELVLIEAALHYLNGEEYVEYVPPFNSTIEDTESMVTVDDMLLAEFIAPVNSTIEDTENMVTVDDMLLAEFIAPVNSTIEDTENMVTVDDMLLAEFLEDVLALAEHVRESVAAEPIKETTGFSGLLDSAHDALSEDVDKTFATVVTAIAQPFASALDFLLGPVIPSLGF